MAIKQPLVTLRAAGTCTLMAWALAAGGVHAQAWQWTDEAGRKVFSDRPPPPTVPDRNITKRPDTPLPPTAPANPASPSTPNTPTVAAASGAPAPGNTDTELEKRQKAAEQSDAARQKLVEQQNAKIRADNCRRAKSAKATLESGVRLSTTNPKGERVFVDDGMRAEESRRLNQIIQSNCGPAPAIPPVSQ